MFKSFAVGPIRDDWTIRFQDVILSKRLGTIELRACDTCWDMGRIRWLLRAVSAIAELSDSLEPDIKQYNMMRDEICRRGIIEKTAGLVDELKSIVDFPVEMLTRTASDDLRELYERDGLVAAYSAMDSGYRGWAFEPRVVEKKQRADVLRGALGFLAYFVPRLPYYAWKGLKEQA
jgi:gamma-glutamyl:cysteine ligase YbdK (ATP-grasp superfamily)